jgi:hypothetical protein
MPIGPTHTKKQKQAVVHTEMHKFKKGALHSGSKSGPIVKSRKQAVAIAMSESGQSKKAPAIGHGESKPGYDRSAHFKGNPGFPKGNSMGKRVLSGPKQSKSYQEAGYKTDKWQSFKTGGGGSPGTGDAAKSRPVLSGGKQKSGGTHSGGKSDYQEAGYPLPNSGYGGKKPTGGGEDTKLPGGSRGGYQQGNFQSNAFSKGCAPVGSNTPAQGASTLGGHSPSRNPLRMSGHPGAHRLGARNK